MSTPPPLCHSTPAKEVASQPSNEAGEQGPEIGAVPFSFGLPNSFAFIPTFLGDTTDLPPDDTRTFADHESVLSRPIDNLPPQKIVPVSSKPQNIPVTEPEQPVQSLPKSEGPEALPGIVPQGFPAEFQESLKLSEKLTESLQRLAGHLGYLSINADKQTIISKPKDGEEMEPGLQHKGAEGLSLKTPWRDVKPLDKSRRVDSNVGVSCVETNTEVVSVSDSKPSGINLDVNQNTTRSRWFIEPSEDSGSRPSKKLLHNTSNLPSKLEVALPKITIPDISTTQPKENPSLLVLHSPAPLTPKPDEKKSKEKNIEEWVQRLPVSKPTDKHVHAFDIDKPIVDVPTNSLPKPKEDKLKFSPPTLKGQRQRRHSDSFCSSGPARFASAVTLKLQDFHEKPKRRPRTPTKKMKPANRSPTKPEQLANEAPDTKVDADGEQPTGAAAATVKDANPEYNPRDPNTLLLPDEELRADSIFAPLVPLRDVKRGSEKTRRFFAEIATTHYEKMWIEAYERVKARRTGTYNPIKQKREFDKRKGEKEVYDPTITGHGSVDWMIHQVFECYFGLRDTLVEIENTIENAKANKLEIKDLQDKHDRGEWGAYLDKEVLATHIRRCEFEIGTVFPDRIKKLQVRKTLLKRAGENNLWDIAKQDERFKYTGEMLNGILVMREYFANIKADYSREQLESMGFNIRHEGF